MLKVRVPVAALHGDGANSANVSGGIWLEIGEAVFPGVSWADEPMSVLGSFKEALTLLLGGEEEADFYFFEGPYYVKLTRSRASLALVTVTAICDRYGLGDASGQGVVQAVTESSLEELKEALSCGIDIVHKWVRENAGAAALEVADRLLDAH